jgi:predicted metal-dependent phosphoesterase TrpH
MPKVDLHTHSTVSHDGGISKEQYKLILEGKVLDYVAITDHNTAQLALELHAEWGERVIVGEEIMTNQGEIIGLFLTKTIQPDKSAKATVAAIKTQGGLVYIPHPLETRRKGLSLKTIENIADSIDIIETGNPRAVGTKIAARNRQIEISKWLEQNPKLKIALATSSDGHGVKALGRNYVEIKQAPNPKNLVDLLRKGKLVGRGAKIIERLYPSWHRLRRKLIR